MVVYMVISNTWTATNKISVGGVFVGGQRWNKKSLIGGEKEIRRCLQNHVKATIWCRQNFRLQCWNRRRKLDFRYSNDHVLTGKIYVKLNVCKCQQTWQTEGYLKTSEGGNENNVEKKEIVWNQKMRKNLRNVFIFVYVPNFKSMERLLKQRKGDVQIPNIWQGLCAVGGRCVRSELRKKMC